MVHKNVVYNQEKLKQLKFQKEKKKEHLNKL